MRMADKKKPPSLNAKQLAFARAYIESYNGTKAAVAAGYSEKTAGVQAYGLLKNPHIRRAIAQLQLEQAHETSIERTFIVDNLKRLAVAARNDSVKFAALVKLGQLIGMWAPQQTPPSGPSGMTLDMSVRGEGIDISAFTNFVNDNAAAKGKPVDAQAMVQHELRLMAEKCDREAQEADARADALPADTPPAE